MGKHVQDHNVHYLNPLGSQGYEDYSQIQGSGGISPVRVSCTQYYTLESVFHIVMSHKAPLNSGGTLEQEDWG